MACRNPAQTEGQQVLDPPPAGLLVGPQFLGQQAGILVIALDVDDEMLGRNTDMLRTGDVQIGLDLRRLHLVLDHTVKGFGADAKLPQAAGNC